MNILGKGTTYLECMCRFYLSNCVLSWGR